MNIGTEVITMNNAYNPEVELRHVRHNDWLYDPAGQDVQFYYWENEIVGIETSEGCYLGVGEIIEGKEIKQIELRNSKIHLFLGEI